MSKLKLSFKQFSNKAFFENTETGSCLFIKKGDGAFNNSNNEIKCLFKNKKDGDQLLSSKEGEPLPDLTGEFSITHGEVIYGFYELLSGTYVALVQDSETYVDLKVESREFYIKRVKSVKILPLFKNQRELGASKQEEENKYLHLLSNAFSESSLFFSPAAKYDITNTYQRSHLVKSNFTRYHNS